MNSKDKGNIGEAVVLAEFIKYGIQVSIPFGDNARYDLVADFNGKLNRIQVKYCGRSTENNSILCSCASSTNHTTNKHRTTYNNEIDYFVFYIPDLNQCCLIPIEDIHDQKTFTLRLEQPKNTNQHTLHYIQDYTFDKYFSKS